MVDTGTYNRMSADEQSEFQRYTNRFVKAVIAAGITDGFEFQQQYRVESDGEWFYLSNGTGAFAGIKSRYKRAIEALHTDAVQNLGR